ncbi:MULTISPECIES: MBL fold metallo-hydrolase [Streptomyces]|uniref:MBL fold metallo-hydrolase n=2 Tax=Streptomyces TaxID=1883 RepID=A0A646KKF9_STRJU|nr:MULTISPECIES: MBL fold metallo-hydrolase [Streptomyces]MQS36072.1 MBL fold metallo-hydrolase [Streptomyces katsurahamanus]MQT02713.1 MBL fold metallo-hydrolase [Streptomyces jumonjinensis]
MNRSTFRRAASAAVAVTASVALLSACGGKDADDGDKAAPAATPEAAASEPAASEAAADAAFTVTHIGGPTTILEIAGSRILIDPTFDAPKKYKSGLEKTQAPAFGTDKIGEIDAVLLSHHQHDDNLDDKGRALLKEMPVVLSTPGARKTLGDHVTGMKSWDSQELKTPSGTIKVTAVPGLHGPDGVDRGADGEVTGFVLSGKSVPTTYISGDNASVKVAKEVGDRVKKEIGPIDTAVLFAGAARTPAILDNAPLTLTSKNAAQVAKDLDPRKVVPVHTDSWNIYSQDTESVVKAFQDQGIDGKLVDLAPAGGTKNLS